MTAPDPGTRYDFRYTTVADDIPTTFSLGGISEDVAKGIRFGLRKVTSIKDVVAERVQEQRQAVAGGDPA